MASFADHGTVECVDVEFKNGKKSERLHVERDRAGIRQGRIYVDAGREYDGSLWVKREAGAPQLTFRIISSKGDPIASAPFALAGSDWQEVHYSFTSPVRDTQASVEIAAAGSGTLLVDFISMMRADVRRDGMLRPDLLQALRDLAPPFIRWPGGSFASTYKWKDGIGPHVSRRYHPNMIWGGYSDYYGFGTEEFLGLCRKLNAEPLIVLAAPSTDSEQVQYAMDWVHYLNDPPTTEWGRLRASNGHPEPYGVRHFQIDNEPMNNGFTPEKYSEIVNVYGSRLRAIAPQARIVACGQKRSNDMVWSQKVIDLAGKNFDVLGVHNYEYEPENFETGLRRIRDYLFEAAGLCPRFGASADRDRRPGVEPLTHLRLAGRTPCGRQPDPLRGTQPRSADELPGPLMRNTTDDPTWTAFIYHDHVSWFPGSAYPVEKLFREHYAERYLASTSGAFRDIPDRKRLFEEISTMRPDDWMPGTVDAIATASADNRRFVIKAVNYGGERNSLLVRLQGAGVPEKAVATLHTISAGLKDSASLDHPDAIAPVSRTLAYAKDFTWTWTPIWLPCSRSERNDEAAAGRARRWLERGRALHAPGSLPGVPLPTYLAYPPDRYQSRGRHHGTLEGIANGRRIGDLDGAPRVRRPDRRSGHAARKCRHTKFCRAGDLRPDPGWRHR